MKSFGQGLRILGFLSLYAATALFAVMGMRMQAIAYAYSGPTLRSHVGVLHKGNAHITLGKVAINATGTHFLYIEDGTCPDSIDVYNVQSTTLTHVGNYPNNGCQTRYPYFGTQSIGVRGANGMLGGCLVYADFAGFVDSFPINANGSLGSEVSHLADNATPEDIHISSDGTLVYVASPAYPGSVGNTSQLESYALGADCTLTALTKVHTTQFYISIALVSPTRLVTVDSNTGNIDTYALTSSGGITFKASVSGQFSTSTFTWAEGVAVQTTQTVTNVFTGFAGQQSQVQGGQYTAASGAITFLSGSPAMDPNGSDGPSVIFDSTDSLLIQAEPFSGTLGAYSVSAGTPGKPGAITFLAEAQLAVEGEHPTDFALLGSTLFVDPRTNGDVEACNLSPNGVSGCTSVAMLTSVSGFAEGIAIL